MVLKWLCFILMCTDVIGYIIGVAKGIEKDVRLSSRLGTLIGLLFGVAARVYVLYNTANYWLLA